MKSQELMCALCSVGAATLLAAVLVPIDAQMRYALTQAERQEILRVANEPRFADMPPARIVPMLADEGRYIASESSFARVLRAHGQNRHRGRMTTPLWSRCLKQPSTAQSSQSKECNHWHTPGNGRLSLHTGTTMYTATAASSM